MTPRERALRDAAEAVLRAWEGRPVKGHWPNFAAALDALAEALRGYEDGRGEKGA